MNNQLAMREIITTCFLLTFSFTVLRSQVNITSITENDAEFLVRDIFLGGGQCFEVFNVQLTGAVGQAGLFSEGNAILGFDTGIVLSNGNVENLGGPNTGYDIGEPGLISTGYGTVSNDPDLQTLSIIEGAGVTNFFDAVILEFDFTPTLDSISFDFVFASEEYCQYSLSSFIDLFGFFIDGPGINGPFTNNGINIALVPGTDDPITARTVSPFFNNNLYRNNIPPGNAGCSLGAAAPQSDYFGFDGYTVPLVAKAGVIPCETYHIRLVMADRGFDDQLDAAVFLRANSFAAGRTSTISSEVNGPSQGDDSPYEDCGFTSIIFTRGDSIMTNDLTVTYDILPSSTATNGIDFTMIPDSVIIPAGQFADTLDIEFFQDDITEGTEFFTIALRNPCDCSQAELTINIIEGGPFTADIAGPSFICEGDGLELAAIPINPLGEVTYEWQNGDVDSIFQAAPMEASTYSLIIDDGCNRADTVTYFVDILAPSGHMDGNAIVCDGLPELSLPVTLDSGFVFTFDLERNGELIQNYSGIAAGTFLIPMDSTGVYEIVNLSADGCPGEVSGQFDVLAVDIVSTAVVDSVDCNGGNDGSILVTPNQGSGSYTYSWEHDPSLTTRDITGLAIGSYTIFIEDSNGCMDTLTTEVFEPTPLELDLDTTQLVANCLDNAQFSGSASGGVLPYTFNWSDGNTANTASFPAGNHSLTILDANNCQSMTTFNVPADSIAPIASVTSEDTLNCINDIVILDASNTSQGPNFQFSWTNLSGTPLPPTTANTLEVDAPDVYTLLVTNTDNGCTNSTSVTVPEFTMEPMISLATTPDSLNCATTQVGINIDLAGSGNYEFNWSGNGIVGSPTSEDITINSAGEYQVIATDQLSYCTDTLTISVGSNEAVLMLTPLPDTTLTCTTDNITLAAQNISPDWTINWELLDGTPLGNDPDLNVSTAGTYVLIVDQMGTNCSAQDTVIVTTNQTPPVVALANIPAELNCDVNSSFIDAAVNSGSGLYTFDWTGPNDGIESDPNLEDITAGVPGDYQLILTDVDNGCTDTLTTTITLNVTDLVIDPLPDSTITCAEPTISYEASSPSAGNLAFRWEDAIGNILSNTAQFDIDSPGEYTIFLTDSNSDCAQQATINIGIDTMAPPVQPILADTLDCEQTSITLSAVPGPDNHVPSWRTGMGIILPSTDWTQEVSQPGGYMLVVEDSDNGCMSTVIYGVEQDTVTPQAQASALEILTCERDAAALSVDVVTGSGLYAFNWDGPGITSPNNLSEITGAIAGDYSVVITDLGNSCTDTLVVSLLEDRIPPTLLAINDTLINCYNPTITLEGQTTSAGNLVYAWSNIASGAILSNTNQLNVDANGTYQVLLTNILNGCADSIMVQVDDDFETPIANAGADATILCGVPDVSLSGTIGPNEWQPSWTGPNGPAGTDWSISTNTPGNYQLLVLDITNGCTATDEATVDVDQNVPVADAGISQASIDCFSGNALIDASGSTQGIEISYTLLDATGMVLEQSSTPSFELNTPGTYTLLVNNEANNCSASTDFTLTQDQPLITDFTVDNIECGEASGSITFDNVLGGTPPFLYSIDGGINWLTQSSFNNLPASNYSLAVQDANGCEDQVNTLLTEAASLEVILPTEIELVLGDSIQLSPQLTIDTSLVASVKWETSAQLSCNDCLYPYFSANHTERLTITVTDENGCSGVATVLIIVDREVLVYTPNVFSPRNQDGVNDHFTLFGNEQRVRSVRQLRIFDRWGKIVFEKENFPLNIPSEGWDGKVNGIRPNNAVFVYFAEVELADGRVILLEGDVLLLD